MDICVIKKHKLISSLFDRLSKVTEVKMLHTFYNLRMYKFVKIVC